MLNLALIAALAATVFGSVSGNTNHHRERRALPALLAHKAGGSGASPLPPHVDPNLGSSSSQLNSMVTGASMSGPLAVLGNPEHPGFWRHGYVLLPVSEC